MKNVFISTVVSICACSAFAQVDPASIPQYLQFGKSTQIIEEIVHPFTVHDYEKLWRVPKLESLDRSSPERVLAYHISAMQSGNYDRAFSALDEVSRNDIFERDKKRGRKKDGYLRDWSRFYAGKTFVVKERINYGDRYVFIPFYQDVGQSKYELMQVLTFVKIESSWWLTVEQAANPILQNWSKPGERVRRMADAIYPK